MQYLGKFSGRGVLQRLGLAVANASYEIEVFRLNQGLVKASGEMSLNGESATNLAGVSRMQLLTDAGEVLEIKRPECRPPSRTVFRFRGDGKPRKRQQLAPLIPRLRGKT